LDKLFTHPRASHLTTISYVTDKPEEHLPKTFQHFTNLTDIGVCVTDIPRSNKSCYDSLAKFGTLRNLQSLQLKINQPAVAPPRINAYAMSASELGTATPEFARKAIPWPKISQTLTTLVLHARLPDITCAFPKLEKLFVWGFFKYDGAAYLPNYPKLEELAIFELMSDSTRNALVNRGEWYPILNFRMFRTSVLLDLGRLFERIAHEMSR